MQSDKEARVRERAHQIWLDEGQVEGKDAEHWHRAERDVAGADEAEAPAPDKTAVAQKNAPAARRKTSSAISGGKAGASGRLRATPESS